MYRLSRLSASATSSRTPIAIHTINDKHTLISISTRAFSSHKTQTNRAIVYTHRDLPSSSLSVRSFAPLPPPPSGYLNIRFLLSPINPADLNVIQGTYPAKPAPDPWLTGDAEGGDNVYVAGNEGLAIVEQIGESGEDNGLKEGDRVVMVKPQAGTWATRRQVKVDDVIQPPKECVSQVQAAMITVNPPTAYNMLTDFVDLKPGDWVVQNGANSAVGQAVIQIALFRGINTINLIRARSDPSETQSLKSDLISLASPNTGTHVLTDEELVDQKGKTNKAILNQVKEWTGGKDIKLGLNCISGKPTTRMLNLLGQNAHLVSYGAMSKAPLSVPTGLFIFKNLMCHGFWQSRWYADHSRADREMLFKNLGKIIAAGNLREPPTQIHTISSRLTDGEATKIVVDVMRKVEEGTGVKRLFKFEE